MIISHKYKYLYIETPQTGSTAIREELIRSYDGESILRRHATYSEFERQASEGEKKYYVFLSIRNPLDTIVSVYVKYAENMNNRYTDGIILEGRHAIYDFVKKIRYETIKRRGYDFKKYLKKSKKNKYDDISTLDRHKVDGVIRYESINEDFLKIIKSIGIEPRRELPAYNKTVKKRQYLGYYDEDEVKKDALEKCCLYMKIWKYKPPEDWPVYKISVMDKMAWSILHHLRIINWKYLMHGMKMREMKVK